MARGYASDVVERYQGEGYGEALFRVLAEQAGEEARRAKLRVGFAQRTLEGA